MKYDLKLGTYEYIWEAILCARPAKILSPFLSTTPLQYVLKILFTQATVDGLINNKTKNALHDETVILNHIGGYPNSHDLSN